MTMLSRGEQRQAGKGYRLFMLFMLCGGSCTSLSPVVGGDASKFKKAVLLRQQKISGSPQSNAVQGDSGRH